VDEYVCDLMDGGTAIWVAELSTGEVVYMDDGRPGSTGSAWLRLGRRVREEGLKVVDVRLKFRSEERRGVPRGADGYFFSKAAAGAMGEPADHFYLLGALAGGVLTVGRWAVPELIRTDTSTRDPESAGERLILNNV
jgi:hypothetical protein